MRLKLGCMGAGVARACHANFDRRLHGASRNPVKLSAAGRMFITDALVQSRIPSWFLASMPVRPAPAGSHNPQMRFGDAG